MKNFIFLLLFSTNLYASSWECIVKEIKCNTWRMYVQNGWIVSTTDPYGKGIVFISDKNHIWNSNF